MPGTSLSGRRRKPTRELQISGSRWLNKRKNEPDPVSPETMTMPKDYNEVETEIWQFHYQMLYNNRTLSATDFPMLDLFCRTYAEYLKLEADIKANGLTLCDADGNSCIRAEVKLRNDTRREFRSLCAQFGFSPSSRASVKVIDNKPMFNRWAVRKLT